MFISFESSMLTMAEGSNTNTDQLLTPTASSLSFTTSGSPATGGDDVQVIAASQQPPEHPVATATMDDFDGTVFKVNNVEYTFKNITAQVLRKFCVKNNVKKTDGGGSLRKEPKRVVEQEIKMMKTRIHNGERHPWDVDVTAEKKKAWVNQFRLANVIFSDELKEDMNARGACLTKEELDLGLKTDQKLYQKIADEYNKKDVPDYDKLQYSYLDVQGRNVPSNFDPITWNDVKTSFKTVVAELEKCRNNFETSGTNDSDVEEEIEHGGLKLRSFTNKQYILYWNMFAEDNPDLFKNMSGELAPDVFNETGSVATSSSKKKKRKDDVAEVLNVSNDLDKRRLELEEKKHEMDMERRVMDEKKHAMDMERHEIDKKRLRLETERHRSHQQRTHIDTVTKLNTERIKLEQQRDGYKKQLYSKAEVHEDLDRKTIKRLLRERRNRNNGDNDDDDDDDSVTSLIDHVNDVEERLHSISKMIVTSATWLDNHREDNDNDNNDNNNNDNNVNTSTGGNGNEAIA